LLSAGRDHGPLTTESVVAERLGVSGKTKSVVRRENVFYAGDDPVNRVTCTGRELGCRC